MTPIPEPLRFVAVRLANLLIAVRPCERPECFRHIHRYIADLTGYQGGTLTDYLLSDHGTMQERAFMLTKICELLQDCNFRVPYEFPNPQALPALLEDHSQPVQVP